MRYIYQTYRRSPYAIIVSRWKRHVIHALAFVGLGAVVYVLVLFHG